MAEIMEHIDSLPYIDPEITSAEREDAYALIQKEQSSQIRKSLHPSIKNNPESRLSQGMLSEIERVGSGQPRQGGIDLTRYAAPEQPEQNSDVEEWRAALRHMYTSNVFLAGRQANLSLLEEHGKNAWLISNAQLEALLKELEDELAHLKQETESLNKERKLAQENTRAEMVNLDDTWKKGIGKIIEIQVATQGLRQQLSQRKDVTAG